MDRSGTPRSIGGGDVIEYKAGTPRNQIYLFQHSLEELIERDNVVRFIDAYGGSCVSRVDMEIEIKGRVPVLQEFIFKTDSVCVWGDDNYNKSDLKMSNVILSKLGDTVNLGG
jgi:hypothetical protein